MKMRVYRCPWFRVVMMKEGFVVQIFFKRSFPRAFNGDRTSVTLMLTRTVPNTVDQADL